MIMHHKKISKRENGIWSREKYTAKEEKNKRLELLSNLVNAFIVIIKDTGENGTQKKNESVEKKFEKEKLSGSNGDFPIHAYPWMW